MKLSQVKALLPTLDQVVFKLENGAQVPPHFHVTEVGKVVKDFIDCGGTLRSEHTVNFQLWTAQDHDHRLSAQKLLNIIQLSEQKLNLEDAEVEVEYQSHTIGKYRLAFDGEAFILQNTLTACLAQDQCGVPQDTDSLQSHKKSLPFSKLKNNDSKTCTPEGGCC